MTRHTHTKLFLCLLLSIAFALPSLAANKVIEQYQGFAVAMGTAATGAKSTINVGIFRWTTDEERANFLTILKDQGPEALHKAMFKTEQVAFLKVGGSLGYQLHFARDYKDPATGKRHMIFAADRPITFGESRNTTRSEDYSFSFVELIVDENGKGEGALAFGIALKWNAEKDVPELETYSSEAVRIMNVTKVKVKN
jgi:hypothetical protein